MHSLAHKICPACGARAMGEHRFCPSCGADISGVSLRDGDPYLEMVLAERYRLEALIGEGAMGRVYRAEQTALGKRFAVKILHPHLTHDPDSHARFANEAHNAASLNHPNVVSVVDYGRTKDGVTYLVMEFVEGRTLEEIITSEFPLARDRIIDLTLQVLSALTEAHGLGILHRDLKPENILITELRTHGELLKVLDFGIAKLMDTAPGPQKPGLTSQGVVCGTPEFMSPEQARGFKLDGRSDLYAVGVILYAMLTGRLPFESESAVEVLHKHIHELPIPPSQLLGRAIDALEEVCLKALSKDRNARFAHAEEFRDALVSANQAEQPEQELHCVSCGSSMRTEDKFCSSCGAAVPKSDVRPMRRRSTRLSELSLRAAAGEPTAEVVVRTFPLPLGGTNLVESARDMLVEPAAGLATQVVAGQTGSGKTRILDEIAALAESLGWQVFATGAEPSGASPSLWPIRQIISQVLRLDLQDSQGAVEPSDLGRASNLIGLSFEALPGLAELYRLDGPAGAAELAVRRRECFASAVQTMLAGGCGKPLLLAFDDIDRYDAASRRILQRLARSDCETPMIVLVSSGEAELGWLRGAVHNLEKLSAADVEAMVRETTEGVSPDSTLPKRLASGAPVSPFRIEQQLRVLAAGLELDVGASDERLVMERFGNLEKPTQNVLQVAAVLGDRMADRDLQAVLRSEPGAPSEWDMDEALTALHVCGLLVISGRGERAFGHRLVREVVLATVPEERRLRLHRSIARHTETAQRNATVRAMHLMRAGDPRVVDVLREAGSDAVASFDDRKAVSLLRAGLRACDALPMEERPRCRADLTIDLVDPLTFTSAQREAADAVRRALTELGSHGGGGDDPTLEAELQRALGKALSRSGRHREATEALQRALGPVIAQGDRATILDLYRQLGLALTAAGEGARALTELMEGLDMCTLGEGPRARLDVTIWRYLLTVAGLHRDEGELRRARTWYEHALFQAEHEADPLGLLRCHTEMAWVLRDLRQHTLAEQHLARALEQARYFGDRLTTAELLLERARFRALAGKLDDAQRCLTEARRLASVVEWTEGVVKAERALEKLPS